MTLVFLLSVSCSFKSLIVSKLDYFVTEKISDELVLNSEQEEELRKDIKKFLNANKDSAKSIKNKLNNIDVNEAPPIEALRKQYFEITDRLIPIISKYYFKLSVDQKKEFFKHQERKNKDIQKKMERMSVKTVSKKYDGFFGYINDEQKKLISNNLPLLKKIAKERIRRRTEIQQALKIAATYKQTESALNLFSKSMKKNSKLNDGLFSFIRQMLQKTNSDQKKILNEKKIELIQILEYYITNTY